MEVYTVSTRNYAGLQRQHLLPWKQAIEQDSPPADFAQCAAAGVFSCRVHKLDTPET